MIILNVESENVSKPLITRLNGLTIDDKYMIVEVLFLLLVLLISQLENYNEKSMHSLKRVFSLNLGNLSDGFWTSVGEKRHHQATNVSVLQSSKDFLQTQSVGHVS